MGLGRRQASCPCERVACRPGGQEPRPSLRWLPACPALGDGASVPVTLGSSLMVPEIKGLGTERACDDLGGNLQGKGESGNWMHLGSCSRREPCLGHSPIYWIGQPPHPNTPHPNPPQSTPPTRPEVVLSKGQAGNRSLLILTTPPTLDRSLVLGSPRCNVIKLRSTNGSKFKGVRTGNDTKEQCHRLCLFPQIGLLLHPQRGTPEAS